MKSPNNCLKGIPNNDFLQYDSFVRSHLFYFKGPEDARADGWIEQSVNWEDDELAIDFTLNQKKDDGKVQFEAGIAVVPTEEIKRLSKSPPLKDRFSYERKSVETNKYHGNLLLINDTPKVVMKQLAAALALQVSSIVKQK